MKNNKTKQKALKVPEYNGILVTYFLAGTKNLTRNTLGGGRAILAHGLRQSSSLQGRHGVRCFHGSESIWQLLPHRHAFCVWQKYPQYTSFKTIH